MASEFDIDLNNLPKEIITEDGKKMPFERDKLDHAIRLVNKIRTGIFAMAADISEFYENNYHLYLGLTKDESAKKLFGVSTRYVQQMQFVYAKFGSDFDQMSYLGFTKLRVLSDLQDEQIKDLAKTGVIRLESGEEITVEEIAEARTKDLENKLKLEAKNNSQLRTRYAELKKEKEAEIKELTSELTDLKNIVDADPEDRKFFKRITSYREAKIKAHEALSLFHAGYNSLLQIDSDDKAVLSHIEGAMVACARYLISLEEQYGASLGYYKEAVKTMAGKK